MSERKSTSIWIWILAIAAIILLFLLGFVLGKSKSVSYSDINDYVQSEVTKQLYEQDILLTKQVQKCVDTCPVNINVTLCQLDSCTKTEIKYLVSEASRENLGQYINEENNHLTLLAIIIAALVSIVGIGIPLFLNADMKRQIEEIKKKVEEAEKAKVATEQAKVDAEAAKKDAEKANEEAKESEKAAKASKLFAEAFAEKDLDKKIKLYSDVLVLDPNDATAYNNRGGAYDDKGDHDQAIKDYNEAIRLNSKNALAYYNRGNAYRKKEDYDQAIKDYDEAIELNNEFAEAYNNRGGIYDDKGEYDKAIKDFDVAIKLNPKVDVPYYNRGMVYSKKNKPDLAIDDFKKAVELQPDDINNFNLGMGYVLQTAIDFKERGVLKDARRKAQEGLKNSEEAKDDDWVKIFQKFLDELPPEE